MVDCHGFFIYVTLKCDNGLCKNITSVYKCEFELTLNESFDCTNRKNCIELTGLFNCQVVEISFYMLKR